MHIAIIDDLKEDRNELSAVLDCYMKKHQITYTVTEFDNAQSFLQAIHHTTFQLVFMDIYMDEMDGIEAAKKLRQKDQQCKIIFLTITEDYARMGYGLAATYYLLKPLSAYPEEFEEAMRLCQLHPLYDVQSLPITVHNQTFELPTHQIIYIDYQNRLTRIHTAMRTIQIRESFQDVISVLLNDKRFLLCYRGILVNMDYIVSVEKRDFRLSNGETLPLAQRKTKQLREAYRQYIFSKMGGVL